MTTPNDPLFPLQWHFAEIGDLETIWTEFTGNGIKVAVYDDGLQYTHPDLAGNYDASMHFVSSAGTEYDPYPVRSSHGHGTSVAGLLGAIMNNGEGVVGVSPGITLTGVNFIEDLQYRNLDLGAEALRWAANFDIMNSSWGIAPTFASFQNLADPGSSAAWFEQAFTHVAAQGRGGLGTVIVQAAGNDGMDANGDGNNASRFTITVAATDEGGYFASYSNYGSSLLVSAPAATVTTDLTGRAGENGISGALDYTDTFSGTSAATPIVSGVVALMLEANPGLGWRDVQNILAISAAQTGAPYPDSGWFANGATNWNGGGLTFNRDYGFGLVDAYAAVRMAEAWAFFSAAPLTSANEMLVSAGFDDATLGPVTIPDRVGAVNGSVALEVDVGENILIENIQVTLDLEHRSASDLRAWLLAPTGEEFTLLDNNATATFNTRTSWTFEVTAALGMLSGGTWEVLFEDTSTGSAGIAHDVTLDFYGAPNGNDDIHHFTEDFLDLRAAEPARGTLRDENGGDDWLNLAALTGAIDLDLGALGMLEVDEFHWIDFSAGTEIENAVGGDGDDRLTGSGLANALFGGRGDDILKGLGGADLLAGGPGDDEIHDGAGDDTARGEAGDDLFIAGDGGDAYDGGSGFDTVDFIEAGTGVAASLSTGGTDGIAAGDSYAGIEALLGSIFADLLEGDDLANLLDGRAGHDEIDGAGGDDRIIDGAGDDTLRGGAGDDTFIAGEGADDYDGGGGTDAVDFAEAPSGVIADLANGGTGGIAFGDTYRWIEAFFGSPFPDILTGDGGANLIDGRDGDDVLTGGDGDDTIIDGLGNDSVRGGRGDDTFIAGGGADDYDGGDDTDAVDYGEAEEAVSAHLGTGGSAGIAAGDSFASIENLFGSLFDDVLTGTSDANTIEGRGGNDLIDGGDGDDILGGGPGDDILIGGGGQDRLTTGLGRDVVRGLLEDLYGDTITDFDGSDMIVILDHRITRDRIEVVPGSAILHVDADGDDRADGAITLLGSFSGGEILAALSGTTTYLSFVPHVPTLTEKSAVDASLVNGITSEIYLTGDGLTGFRVSLDAARSATNWDNSLGVYEIDGAGRIIDARLLIASQKAEPGATVDITGVEAGHLLGFFLVQNGAAWALGLDDTDVFEFIDGIGGPGATIDSGADVLLTVNGDPANVTVYHAYDESLNADGARHALSGSDPGAVLTIGFEDMTGGGDRDYQDLVFSVSLFDIA